jgi:hypothetical protein
MNKEWALAATCIAGHAKGDIELPKGSHTRVGEGKESRKRKTLQY